MVIMVVMRCTRDDFWAHHPPYQRNPKHISSHHLYQQLTQVCRCCEMSWCLTKKFQEGWSVHWKVWCLLHPAQWEKGQFELSLPIKEDVITRFEANLNWSSCWETLWTSPPLTTALALWTPHSSSPGEGCQKRPKTRLEMRLRWLIWGITNSHIRVIGRMSWEPTEPRRPTWSHQYVRLPLFSNSLSQWSR